MTLVDRVQGRLGHPLVGREPEQRWLSSIVLEGARQPHGRQRVVIEGPAGIGKSTLLRWLVDSVRDRDGTAYVVSATATDLEPPLGAWHRLATDVASRGLRVPRVWLDDEAAPRSAHHWYGAALALLETIAESSLPGRPRLVAIDDLHSADVASLTLWLHVLSSSQDLDLPILMTLRHPDHHPHPDGRRVLALIMNAMESRLLSSLDQSVVTELVVRTAGRSTTDWAERWGAELHALAGGNPLLLHHLIDDLRLAQGERPDLDDRRVVDRVSQPRSRTSDAIERRLATLDTSVLDTLRVAALAEHHANATLLGEVLERSVDVDLRAAQGAGVVEVDDSGLVTFAHPLYPESLRRHHRSGDPERHRLVANALQRRPLAGGDWILLLRHLVAAGNLVDCDELVSTADRAAEAARYRSDAEAEAFALEVLLRHRHSGDRARLTLRVADAQFRAGRRHRCWELAESILTSPDTSDQDRLIDAALLLARGRQYAPRTSDPETVLLELEPRLGADHPRRALVLAAAAELAITVPTPEAAEHGAPLSWRVRPQEAMSILERAEAALTPRTTAADRARVEVAWCSAHRSPDAVEDRRRRAARAAAASAELDTWVAATHRQAVDALMMADRRTADVKLDELRHAAQQTGNLTMRWLAAVLEATLHLAGGELERAETMSKQAFAFGERADEPGRWAARLGHALATGFESRGDLSALQHAPTLVDWSNPLVAAGVVWARVQAGEPTGPGPGLEHVVERWCGDGGRHESWLVVGALAADAVAEARRTDLAAVVFDRLVPYAHRVAVDANGHYCHGSVARPLAALCELLDRRTDERRLSALSQRIDRECGLELFSIAGTIEAHERTLRRSGLATVGEADVADLIECTLERGLARLHRRASSLASAAETEILSHRRLAVLQALAEGCTYSEIARRVGYSHGTVRKEAIAIYSALGVSDRLAAVKRAQHLGILR